MKKLKNYTGYSLNRKNYNRASREVDIYVNEQLPSKQIIINSDVEAIAITIKDKVEIIFCNIYLPNQKHFLANGIIKIISQLPTPLIFMGDTIAHNSYNRLWGSKKKAT